MIVIQLEMLVESDLAKEIIETTESEAKTRAGIALDLDKGKQSISNYIYLMKNAGLLEKAEPEEVPSGHLTNTFRATEKAEKFLELRRQRQEIEQEIIQLLRSSGVREKTADGENQ